LPFDANDDTLRVRDDLSTIVLFSFASVHGDEETAMDVLTGLLADLRVESTLYCRFEARGAWAVAYPAGDLAGYHVVTAGPVWLEMDGAAPLRLETGDVAIVPHGRAHVLRGARRGAPAPVEEVVGRAVEGVARLEGGPGDAASYVCGALRFGGGRDHPLLAALPPVLRVGAAARAHPWVETMLAAVACESSSGRPGAEMVVTRLSEVIFVQAIRAHLDELPGDVRGWLGALREPSIARALALVHRHPERPWSVESLGRAVGMSRSRFAGRFREVVGEPPLAYLAAWRMHRARALLRDGAQRMGGIARALGYGSEAAFSTAFKRETGRTPGEYRRTSRPAAAVA
jgi:AraC-like DNA-binding protein